MFYQLILISLLLLASSLHLRTVHQIQTSGQLRNLVNDILSKIRKTNDSINQNLSSLNPYNQLDRISSLQNIITSSRRSLLDIYGNCIVIQDNQQYYCQSIPKDLQNDIKNTLDKIKNNSQQIEQISPIKNPDNSLNVFPASINSIAQNISNDLSKTGVSVSAQPKEVNRNNFLAQKWVLGNSTLNDLNNKNQLKLGQNNKICPIEKPFLDITDNCMSCGKDYYDLQEKKCINCTLYDENTHKCNQGSNPSGTGTGAGTTNPSGTGTGTNPSGTGTGISNPNNISPSTNTVLPNLRITNTNNLTGLLLPTGISLQEYKQTLLTTPNSQNLLPCPLNLPFYDGTTCISCSNGQYFSSSARVCITCPSNQIYNSSTFHCEQTHFYSNPQAKYWTSIGTPPSDILNKISTTASQQNAKSCPLDSPYFDGNRCISCQGATPIFSYDAMKCTSCIAPTIFDTNIYSCTSRQRMQSNPTTAPNLILQGRSLNQWKTIYFNNQTADPQIADCPTVKPYFDGITCISCPTDKPYFNMQYHVCQICPQETAYDTKVRQCLSTSGNIVTQTPSIMKMAAGIFA